MSYTLTHHARQKIQELPEFDRVPMMTRVLDAAEFPSVVYGVTNQRNQGGNRQERHIHKGLVAVVDPSAGRVITFYADVVETDLRSDQTDDQALAYAAKRADARKARDQKRSAKRDADRAFTFAQKGKKG